MQKFPPPVYTSTSKTSLPYCKKNMRFPIHPDRKHLSIRTAFTDIRCIIFQFHLSVRPETFYVSFMMITVQGRIQCIDLFRDHWCIPFFLCFHEQPVTLLPGSFLQKFRRQSHLILRPVSMIRRFCSSILWFLSMANRKKAFAISTARDPMTAYFFMI